MMKNVESPLDLYTDVIFYTLHNLKVIDIQNLNVCMYECIVNSKNLCQIGQYPNNATIEMTSSSTLSSSIQFKFKSIQVFYIHKRGRG